MKIQKTLNLGSKMLHFFDDEIVLELCGCGRGFVTVESTESLLGEMITLNVGDGSTTVRYFTGYVERSQQVGNGFQRLFVRETVGVLSRAQNLSLRHATLHNICKSLTEQSAVAFEFPAVADYIDRPIPNFAHVGTGYQLLNSLGTAFGISDYIWQVQPDGTVFVGSHKDSFWHEKPVTIPNSFATEQQAGNSMKLPLIVSVRPGAIINGQRISQVTMRGDDMTLSWQPIANTGEKAQATPLRRQIEKAFPELSGALHLPRLAIIEAISDSAALGDICDQYRPRFAVDVQMLDATGQIDTTVPVFHSVPLPAPFSGAEAGFVSYPQVGSVVEVAFALGNPSTPFIRQVFPFRWSLPQIAAGEQLQQQRAEVLQRVTSCGDWQRQTDHAIQEKSRTREVIADEESRELCERKTTVAGDDLQLVGGYLATHSLAGHSIATLGDLDMAAACNQRIAVGGDVVSAIGGNITEQIAGIRKSIAKAQRLEADTTWLGSKDLNVLALLAQLAQTVQELATAAASHTHTGDNGGNTSPPHQASEITASGAQAGVIAGKVQSITLS